MLIVGTTMKTLLFFYLIALGAVLVLSKARRPRSALFTTGINCKSTKAGRDYDGSLSVTRSGRTCQRWDSNQPHQHRFSRSTNFPEGSAEAAGNKCRNPDPQSNGGVWCYTTDPNKRWEECDVPFCGLNCKFTKAGSEYAGPLSVTRSGRTCQRWDSDKPHKHRFQESQQFPEGSAKAAGNNCRNPDPDYSDAVWCYTTDPRKRWEECDVPFCDCKLTQAGRDYAGPLSKTRSGRTCQRWDSCVPHEHRYIWSDGFPECSAEAAGNKCRNPNIDYNEGVWCYTTDPNKRCEKCDVPLCGCRLTKAGHDYAGPLNVTRSGRTCQRWALSHPHEHDFRGSTDFPEGSAEGAGNNCRNPDPNYSEGVWCYTTDPNRKWEECDVPLCYSTPVVPPSTPQISTWRQTSPTPAKVSKTSSTPTTVSTRKPTSRTVSTRKPTSTTVSTRKPTSTTVSTTTPTSTTVSTTTPASTTESTTTRTSTTVSTTTPTSTPRAFPTPARK